MTGTWRPHRPSIWQRQLRAHWLDESATRTLCGLRRSRLAAVEADVDVPRCRACECALARRGTGSSSRTE